MITEIRQGSGGAFAAFRTRSRANRTKLSRKPVKAIIISIIVFVSCFSLL
jgi:hypothetical protein